MNDKPLRAVLTLQNAINCAASPQVSSLKMSRAISLALVATSVAVVSARPAYVALIPNGANVKGFPALGHVNPEGGGANNDFGLDFASAGKSWTKEFCEKDSDGDGQTNGQELGDPCCEWAETSNAVVKWKEGVSHPGNATSKADPSLWASISCGSSSGSTSITATAGSTTGSSAGTVDAGAPSTDASTSSAAAAASSTSSASAASSSSSAASSVAPALFSAVGPLNSTAMSRATLSIALVATAAVIVNARPAYVARLPNGDNVSGVAALGHVDPAGGGANNDFGLAFESAGESWTTEFCQQDSDGDGQTNGQELGDPCCEWVQDSNAVVQWTEGVSHPGDSSSTSDESLWASITCGSSTTNSTSTTTGSGSSTGTVDAGSPTTGATDAATSASAASSNAAGSSSSAASAVTPAMYSAVSVAAAIAAFFM
ncbi:Temptin [Phytophthora citrophthora]|uniref:Temptin n=1 Tax=Phytophthora citrophthora TaxID=4793 RepID=A0AAD9GCA5_9STRA|nr:Temptin [Phytophthora citrophthora]